jgi:hypothetical protein
MDAEIAALRRWKAEQLAVEAEWNEQEVGKLLNLPLGTAVRPAIQPAIEAMREKMNSLEFRLSQEKHRNADHEQDYLAVWKLIKRPDETVVQAAQRIKAENEAMREAIREAAPNFAQAMRQWRMYADMHNETPLSEAAHMESQFFKQAKAAREGFDDQDTIGQEPADDYVLRKLADMRKVIRQVYYDTETYADGAPDASAHDKLCNEISSKLEPFLK